MQTYIYTTVGIVRMTMAKPRTNKVDAKSLSNDDNIILCWMGAA